MRIIIDNLYYDQNPKLEKSIGSIG